jgi:hypothetical protein
MLKPWTNSATCRKCTLTEIHRCAVMTIANKELIMKDKKRAKQIARAIESIQKANELLEEALVPSIHKDEICFSLHCHAVALESDFAYYQHGEVDPVR